MVQISDLHLFEYPSNDPRGKLYERSFDIILDNITKDFPFIDFVVVTGDLAHEPTPVTYDRVFTKLKKLSCPFLCIAGNHDVTYELNCHLPFEQREHLPVVADKRLVDCHQVETPYWNLLFLDSSVPGKVYGSFPSETLNWLDNSLKKSKKPCIVFNHHHVLPVGSTWIDNHMLKNHHDFWKIVSPYQQKLKAVIVGHVHQEHHLRNGDISMYSVPATSVQFKPFEQNFCLDKKNQAGFRWITLYNDGKLETGVKRLDTM